MTIKSSTQIRMTPARTIRKVPWQAWLERGVLYLVLLACVITTGAPYLYMITGALKENAEIFSFPLHFLPEKPTLVNYQRLLGGEELPFLRQFGNSAIVAVSQTALSLLFAAMVGWGFAKFEFRAKRVLFLILLGSLTIPFQIILVPLYLLMLSINWLDSYLAIIVPGAVSAFGAFFMRQNMLSIPSELVDAARIDGSSEWGIFWRIGLPLARGALSVLAVLTFLGAWNDYLWPLIVLRSMEKFTYPLGLATLYGLYKIEYGMILAGAFIATVPIVAMFIAGRNQLLNNLTIGAIKG